MNVVITGACGGLGLACSEHFAGAAETVYMLCRSQTQAQISAQRIQHTHPSAQIHCLAVDLEDLCQVEQTALALRQQTDTIDILINNAGLMGGAYGLSRQGIEKHFAVNHLAHFVLTQALYTHFADRPESRIINISSLAHHLARPTTSWHLTPEEYRPWRAYANSKLANLLFTKALDERLRADAIGVRAIACHPGYTATNLIKPFGNIGRVGNRLLAQTPQQGIAPIVMAAYEDVPGGSYWGPGDWFGLRGTTRPARFSAKAADTQLAADLWVQSLRLSGWSDPPPEAPPIPPAST